MTIQIASSGAQNILKSLTGDSAGVETLVMKLYSNNLTVTPSTVVTDFTEVTGGGYASKSLSISDWTLTGNSISTSPQVFNFTASVGNIYGYYLVGSTSGRLIASERFTSGPYNITTNGDNISVVATISVA